MTGQKIVKVLAVPSSGAYYTSDLAALQENPLPVAAQHTADPVTEGFRRVREVAEAVSVGLVLEPTSPDINPGLPVAWGDSVGVAYAGHAGRDPVFRAANGLSLIRRRVSSSLVGRELTSFREMAAEIDALRQEVRVERSAVEGKGSAEPPRPNSEQGFSRRDLLTAPLRLLQSEEAEQTGDQPGQPPPKRSVTVERPLPAAVRYGVSQALLQAVALARRKTMAEVIVEEWALPQPGRSVPIHAQSGGHRRANAEKMILRRIDSLPHAFVENIPEHLGEDGEELVKYVQWLAKRIADLGGKSYRPAVHLDVHGALGRIYENNLGRILGYLYRLESYVQPLTLRVESPVIMESRGAQIETLRTLREYVRFRNMGVEIVADEWANSLQDVKAFLDAEAADMIQIKMPDVGSVADSVEAVLACKAAGIAPFLGGSCAETDISARVTAHVALATQPAMVMAKPGLGVDEAVSLLKNEMTRTLVVIKTRGT